MSASSAAPAHLLRCPVCRGTSLVSRYDFGDFRVLRCTDCSVAWRSNMYTPEEIVAMYSSEEYDAHPFFAFDDPEAERRAHPRFPHFTRALDAVEAEIGTGRVLDVGCGAGTFLWAAQERGWEAHGIELSPRLVEVAQRTAPGAQVQARAFEEADLARDGFDLVTMWDVIEHVLDPLAFVARAREVLRPGGMLIVCTPDEDSLLANVGRALYGVSRGGYAYPALALHPKYHTFFFSRSSLEGTLERAGLRIASAYSQHAFFDHSPLAGEMQKRAMSAIEGVAAVRDANYETVVFARA